MPFCSPLDQVFRGGVPNTRMVSQVLRALDMQELLVCMRSPNLVLRSVQPIENTSPGQSSVWRSILCESSRNVQPQASSGPIWYRDPSDLIQNSETWS